MTLAHTLKSVRRGMRLAARIARANLADTASKAPAARRSAGEGVVDFGEVGPNPGGLRLLAHGARPPPNRPLVVLLHGCGQTAAAFAHASGWAALADRLGFALLLPEQVEANNHSRCFRWFQADDTVRGRGEGASIATMTRWAIQRFDAAPDQVFVAGLSAGGAMAAALLAAYPDLFRAGAVVAGMPVGSAQGAVQALMRMAHAAPALSTDPLGNQARLLAPDGYAGPWPRLSVWHGLADDVVVPGNGDILAAQWRALHGLPDAPAGEEILDGVSRRVWGDPEQPAVEQWVLPAQPHGYPVGPATRPKARFMLAAPVAATSAIAHFWGLADA